MESMKKTVYGYVTWSIFMIFSVLMISMSMISSWGVEIDIIVLIMMALMTFITFSKSIDATLQSYLFTVSAMFNIFLYSYMRQELYPTIIIACCGAILISVYMEWRLLVLWAGMSLGMVVFHVAVLGTVPFTTGEDVLVFFSRILAMVFAEVFLMVFVQRLKNVENSLKDTIEVVRQAEHSKADFLANMSHEIRTPMNAIVGMCELILREDINDEVRENCFNIQNSGRSLLSIINDILDFSKIESGKAELIEDEFNIGSTINDVLNMAMTRKGDKKLEIIARVDPNIPKGLMGDEVRIKQVIVNLVTNAIKFTNSGCVILRVSQNVHEYGINLNVSVKDTGIGITDENLEKLFTSFQQVDTKKNRAVEGTGLGLAISKRLVTKMGGFINVSSVYGDGSEFKFVIPLKVTNHEPFIYVKDKTNVNIAVYIDDSKYNHSRIKRGYRNLINELGEKFDVSFTMFDSMEELKNSLTGGNYTHCFTAREEYSAEKAFFDEMAEKLEIMVVQDRNGAIEVAENIKCIYKPFYALSVATVLNKEKHFYSYGHKNNANNSFTAPDARILIVDDNVTNLKVASGLMKPYDMKILTAENGPKAIEIVKEKSIDIIFMDHMMPGMDGIEATRIIRSMADELKDEYFRNVPIVALTANAINGVKEMFLSEGFNDFIAKPIELSLLARCLKSWLPEEYIISSHSDVQNMDDIDDKLLKIHSNSNNLINIDKGMMYTGGDKEVYIDVLKSYTDKGAEYRQSLNKRFKEEDWKNYIIEVHALKSSSLSIGSGKLSELAKTLELAGKEGDYELIRKRHLELSDMYQKVLMEAMEYLKENDIGAIQTDAVEGMGEIQEISIEELSSDIERIRAAYESFDGDEIVSIANKLCGCSVKGESLRAYFSSVSKYADDFEYEKAYETAAEVISKLEG